MPDSDNNGQTRPPCLSCGKRGLAVLFKPGKADARIMETPDGGTKRPAVLISICLKCMAHPSAYWRIRGWLIAEIARGGRYGTSSKADIARFAQEAE